MSLRNEYPRPQFQRDAWLNLNGAWNFTFDDENIGVQNGWFERFPENRSVIQVPFAYQTKLSGIHDSSFHDVIWYHREVHIPSDWNGKELLLHFGAVDYRAWVYVNGQLVVFHEGGNTPFTADITNFVTWEAEQIVVRVEDPSVDETIPRGKQYWHEQSASIFYTRTSGIWQTVWLEPVSPSRIDSVKITPDVDHGDVMVEYNTRLPSAQGSDTYTLQTDILYDGRLILSDVSELRDGGFARRVYHLTNRCVDRSNTHGRGWYWSPESPNLFTVRFRLLRDNKVQDEVDSYFGLRKVSIENGQFMLNNRPYYQKLVLDQGYFLDGLLTAPTDEDLKRDIELAKEMGFNGARKHQKVEDPRYLYWADHLGFLVWGEMANCVEFSAESVGRLTREWIDVIQRDYNHPSIVVWVPINESWGVSAIHLEPKHQAHATSMYWLTKSLDQTRLAVSNDGWEHTISDLCTIHNYRDADSLKMAYKTVETSITTTPARRTIYANGFSYRGEPILVTEYGGIAYQADAAEGWGYSSVSDGEALLEAYQAVTLALMESTVLQGFCYTQLTDVEQEMNGLLTYQRIPKCNLSFIREINEQLHRN